MPKDYAKRARENAQKWNETKKPKGKKSKSKKQKRSFPWRAILVLIVLAIGLVALIIYIKVHASDFSSSSTHQSPGAVVKKAKPAEVVQAKPILDKTLKKPKTVQFDFYSMLPKMSVEVAGNQPATPGNADNKVHYLLQLASLPNTDDAAAFQSKVNKLGFHSKIATVTRGDTKWYRVQLGPFDDIDKAKLARDQLHQEDVNGILLAIKNQ